jgi:hypothetical protein
LLNNTLLIGISWICLAGCTSAEGESAQESSTAAAKPTDSNPHDPISVAVDNAKAREPAVLSGSVVFQGPLPPLREIVATKDVEYCGKHVGPRPEVVVSESGGLAGAVIEIRGLKEPEGGWAWIHPDDGYSIH